MQKVIDEMRKKLNPFLEGGGATRANAGLPQVYDMSRILRKIPEQNYEGLRKMAPISWL